MKTHRMRAAAGRLLAALAVLATCSAQAQSPNFILTNNTGFTVYSVHIWPSVSGNRGRDRLGDDTIPSGASYEFRPNMDECMYNIRIQLEDSGYEKQWDDVDLCSLVTLTLNYNYQTRSLWASKQ